MNFFKILIVVVLFSKTAFSQNSSENNFLAVDQVALAIPKSMTKSTDLIAKYITSNYKTNADKTRAAFIWTASNISYDTNYSFDTSENRNDKIERSLQTGRGICENYAALFTEICNKVGVRSFVIEGYTKQNSVVNSQSHVWSACQIDGSWYLFDTTWGAGYIKDGKFISKINNTYFQQKPEIFLESHMPFDYLWQFSNSPISNQDFYDGKMISTLNIKRFDFKQALLIYEAQNYISRLRSTSERVKENGLVNTMIKNQYLYIEKAIDHIHQNKVIALYNAAAAHYNKALSAYNDFVEIRNSNQRNSNLSMKKMVVKAEIDIKSAKEILKSLPYANSKTTLAVNKLRKSISSVNNDVQKQKLWLAKN